MQEIKSVILKVVLWSCLIFFVMTILLSIIVSNNIGFSIESSNDWIGYYGMFIGSVFTSVISIVGIIITLDYYRNKDKDELNILKGELELLKEQVSREIKPYFTISSRNTSQNQSIKIQVTNNPSQPNFYRGERIELKNVGNGAAIDCRFNFLNNSEYNKEYNVFACAKNDTYDIYFDIAPDSFGIGDEQHILIEYKDIKGKENSQVIKIAKQEDGKFFININPPKFP